MQIVRTRIFSCKNEIIIFQEIVHDTEVRDVMKLTELEKIRASADLSEAVYFLHGHSKPIIHDSISSLTAVVDGETHRARFYSKTSLDRLNVVKENKIDG